MSRETLLHYPNFNETFEIHMDTSHTQLGAMISQNNKPIAFYSRKLSPAQTRYTTTERELLSIVETLKEFRNILLGQQLKIYTDHKNLTYKQFNTERVMRWRLLLEEYSPQLEYLPGSRNVVADALSRLQINTTPIEVQDLQPDVSTSMLVGTETLNNLDDLSEDSFPLTYKLIAQEQQKDQALLKLLKEIPNMMSPNFMGVGNLIP